MKLDEAYTILGLQPGCDSDDMRKAFRQQALKWHPDKNSNNPECTEQFQRIQAAYAKLTREFCGEYSDESEDDYYDDYYDDEDDEDDYDCDCFFHGGIPPWEFFEQLFAAMESGQCNGKGFPPFPFQPGGMFGGHSHAHGHSHGHSSQYREQQEPDPYYDRSYVYESREERRHREREEQKLEKMWRKEMEMAERENIRAANAAKAARSVAQERNVRAWMRQMPRPTMASRSDNSIELLLARRGVNTAELPSTCITKLEKRKNGEPNWTATEVDKDTSKYTFENLEPGASYFFRVCGGQRSNDSKEAWGEWSVESRYATTGKAQPSAAQGDPAAADRNRKGRNSIGGKPIRTAHSTPSHHAVPDAADEIDQKAAEEEKAREEEKERAIQKALAEAAADYEFGEMSFKAPDESSKKKKKKKKGKMHAETKAQEDSAEPEMQTSAPKAVQKAADSIPKPIQSSRAASQAQESPEPLQEGLSESEALARAIEESLAIYNDSISAKKAVEEVLGPQHTWDRADALDTAATKTRMVKKGAESMTQTAGGGLKQKPRPNLPQSLDSSPEILDAAHIKQEKMSPRTMARIHQPKVSTICKFFNTDQGCKWGLNCKFQHLDRSSNSRYNKGVPPAPPPPRSADTRAGDVNGGPISPGSRCTHFTSHQGCRFGNQCKFSHEKPNIRGDHRAISNGTHTVASKSAGPHGNPPLHMAGISTAAAHATVQQELGQQVTGHAFSGKFPPGQPQPGIHFQQATRTPAPPGAIGASAAKQTAATPGMVPGGVSAAPSNLQQPMRASMLPPFVYGQAPGFAVLPQGSSPAIQPPVPSSVPLSMFFPSPGNDGPTNATSVAPPPASASFLSMSPHFPQPFSSAHSVFAPVSSAASFPGMDFGVHSMGGMASANGLPGDGSDMQQEEHSAALNAEAFLNSIQDTSSGDPQLSVPAAAPSKETSTPSAPGAGAATGKPLRSAAASRPKYNPLGAGPK